MNAEMHPNEFDDERVGGHDYHGPDDGPAFDGNGFRGASPAGGVLPQRRVQPGLRGARQAPPDQEDHMPSDDTHGHDGHQNYGHDDGHGEGAEDHLGHHGEGEGEDAEHPYGAVEEVHEPPAKSLFSKLIYPLGGLAIGAVVLYQLSPLFLGPSTHSQVAAVSDEPIHMPGQRRLPSGPLTVPVGPMPRSQNGAVGLDSPPPASSADKPLNIQATAQNIPDPRVVQQIDEMHTQLDAMRKAQDEAGDKSSKESQAQIEAVNQLSGKLDALESKVNTTISERMDDLSRQVAGVSADIQALKSTGPAGITVDRAGHPVHGQAVASRTAPAASPQSAQAPMGTVLGSYKLKGVSASEAQIGTPHGLVTIKIPSVLPGVGMAQRIIPYGDSWELVTSSGLIRP